MNKRVKYGIPAIAGAFPIAAGTVGWWCREPVIAALTVVLLALVSGFATAIIVADE